MKKKDLLKEAKTEIDKVETLLINVKKRKIKGLYFLTIKPKITI